VNCDGYVMKLCNIAVSPLVVKLCSQSAEDWNRNDFRQSRYAVHKDTTTIPILFDGDFRHFRPTRREKYDLFWPDIAPVCEAVSDHFHDGGYVIRCILARLRAGGVIAAHVDTGFSLANSHRLHLPLLTNDEVFFSVGDEVVQMRVGELW